MIRLRPCTPVRAFTFASPHRSGPLFGKYAVSGRTYTTASGVVLPAELQYYGGEMAHLYGECTNVAAVNEALAGSGYRAITLRHGDGRQTAAAQIWASRFTETTIGAYNAMFIVVAAVPEGVAAQRTYLAAHPNGASSALVMFDGAFDEARALYENRARLFLVRLLDSTQVAIDVGRERMGTDKRPGTIDMTRDGSRLRIAIADQWNRGVLRADLTLAGDPAALMPDIAAAAATAGVPLRTVPDGTELSYPAAARIGRGLVVDWQWRSDLKPQLQSIPSGSVVVDSSSEEGRMLQTWGFTPKVLAYFPHVRGLVTGLADRSGLSTRAAAGALPLLRLVPEPAPSSTASVPGTHPIRSGTAADAGPQPRYAWGTTFLGSLTAFLRKEVVGVTPDGLRINWHVTQGTFAGAGFDAVVLPGAADWMRIRRDGVAIVNVQACFETKAGARVFGSYSGIFDLGPDGYTRALRDDWATLPPVVVTPTYATADPQLEWLNRAQCVGVGRVDMAALRVEFDVYVVRVGERLAQSSLYVRLGGQRVVEGVTDDFVAAALADPQLGRFFGGPIQANLRARVVDLLCELAGGPCGYKGRDMKAAHQGMGINESDWRIAVNLFSAALDRHRVAPREKAEFMRIIEQMKDQIVES